MIDHLARQASGWHDGFMPSMLLMEFPLRHDRTRTRTRTDRRRDRHRQAVRLELLEELAEVPTMARPMPATAPKTHHMAGRLRFRWSCCNFVATFVNSFMPDLLPMLPRCCPDTKRRGARLRRRRPRAGRPGGNREEERPARIARSRQRPGRRVTHRWDLAFLAEVVAHISAEPHAAPGHRRRGCAIPHR